MRKQIVFSSLVLTVILLSTVLSCSKTDSNSIVSILTLTTTSSSNVTQFTAQSGGSVSSEGGTTVSVRGVCWNTSSNPTISNSKTTDGSGTGSFTSLLTGLSANTKYYIRAYATNSSGTAYGNEISFTTQAGAATLATLTTTDTSAVTDSSVQTGGSITSDGYASVTARGVCWSISENPTVIDNHTSDGNGTGSFTSKITGLTADATYYLRAYATNSAGTAYGNSITFKTKKIEPDSTKVLIISEATLVTNKKMGVTVADFSYPDTTDIEFDSRKGSSVKIAFQSKDNNPAIIKNSNTDFFFAYSDVYKGSSNKLKDADTSKYAGWTITGLDRTKYGFNRAKLIAGTGKTGYQAVLLRVADLGDNEDSLITNQFYNDAVTKNPYGTVKFDF